MSKNLNSHQMSIERMAEEERVLVGPGAKNPTTTKYTQSQLNFVLPESFVLGKNHLIESSTSSELDSSDNESDVSFEERLNSCHQKLMLREIIRYLEIKGALKTAKGFESKSMSKSTEMMKDIEEKIFEEIKKTHGNNEVEKIKLTIKFIKRNENLTEIYYEVINSLPSHLQASVFILFKHSVMAYLKARQQIGSQQNKMKEETIKQYFSQNISTFVEEIAKDQKTQLFYNSKFDQGIRKRFELFVKEWIQSFFLAKEGFPSAVLKEKQKNLKARARIMESGIQKQKYKKVKKF